jgi:hypothetical protein
LEVHASIGNVCHHHRLEVHGVKRVQLERRNKPSANSARALG